MVPYDNNGHPLNDRINYVDQVRRTLFRTALHVIVEQWPRIRGTVKSETKSTERTRYQLYTSARYTLHRLVAGWLIITSVHSAGDVRRWKRSNVLNNNGQR